MAVVFSNPFVLIRKRYHPLFRLRKFSTFQWLTRKLDIPVSVHFENIAHPVYVSLSKNLSWVLSGGRTGEEKERANFIAMIKMAGFRIFFDVGANIGLYGFIFSSLVPDSSVTMFEPDPDNAALIRKTITRAGVAVNLIEAAASSQDGQISFYKDDITGATGSLGQCQSAFIATYHRSTPTEVRVQCVSLDTICSDPASDPDFLKIDTEGAELEVLRGAEVMLSRTHPALFFECDDNQKAVRCFLEKHNYIFFDFSSLQLVESLPHNCLGLHSSKHAPLIEALAQRAAGTPLDTNSRHSRLLAG